MTKVGTYEAKTHLPRLLERVSQGEQITITRHGVPIAKLVPIPDNERMSVDETIDLLKELSKTVTLGGLSIREMINEGRK